MCYLVTTIDLAELYETETKRINEAVKNNVDKFPERVCFQLTKKEYLSCSRFRNGTLDKSNNYRGTNIKYLPYVFTEHGVMMLSELLKSEIATKVNIHILNDLLKYINEYDV